MTDDWQQDPLLQAAAFEGLATNPAIPIEERLAMALQVIAILRTYAGLDDDYEAKL